MDRKEKAREYAKQYRKDNADKIKEYQSTPEYKEKQKLRLRQYRIDNADKIKEQRSTPEFKEKVKEYDRLRWLNNDNNWKEKCAEYRKNNREKLNEKRQEYVKNNPEKIKEYNESFNGRMSKRICDWKRQGLKCDNYEDLYYYFITTEKCEKCDCDLVDGGRAKNSRVMDHCHISGEFRNVLCRGCNATLPKQI